MFEKEPDTVGQWKESLKPFYDKQGSVYCHAVKDNVVFNAYGWKHLTFHSNGRRRNDADSRLRLGLVTRIPEVIKRAQSIRKQEVRQQNFGGASLEVTYYELCKSFTIPAKLGLTKREIRVVVVLRKIGDTGSLHYWTVRYGRKTKSP